MLSYPNAKVTVTKEVAEAIEDVRELFSDTAIIAIIENDRGNTAYGTKMSTLVRFARQAEGNIDLIMRALVLGYTVEKSPEEKVREYYDRCRAKHAEVVKCDLTNAAKHWSGQMVGASITLDILGIKIEGVNA